MIVTFTVFNNPAMLGKDPKRRNVKWNYAFAVHDGAAEHTGVSFHSWAKETKGQVKLYKKPVHRKARKAIEYFKRAIETVSKSMPNILYSRVNLSIVDNKVEIDRDSLISAWAYYGQLIKEVAMTIVENEAFDTGDLLSSVEITEVKITE